MTVSRVHGRPTRLEWIALGGVVWLLAMGRGLVEGFGTTDESWFLQVVSRLRAGDVLYRDVFFGSTPLAVYLTSWVGAGIGIEIVAVKLVTNTCLALGVAVACWVAGRLGASPLGAGRLLMWELAGWMLLYGRSYASAPYTPLANLFFVVACALTLVAFDRLRWDPTRAEPALVGAAAAAAVSFAAKPNFGLLACAVLLLTTVAMGLREPKMRVARHVALIVGVFGAVSLLLLSPIVVTGGVGSFLDYVFVNKTAYVRLASRPYLAQLWAQIPQGGAGIAEMLGTAFYAGVWLLPPAALAAAAVALARQRLDRRAVVVAAFAAAAVAAAYPRFDRDHLAPSALLLLPTLVTALPGATTLGATSGVVVRCVARVALVGGLLALVVSPQRLPWLSRGYVVSTLPGFRGPLVRADEQERLAAAARRLKEFSATRPTFVLGSRAGFLYVASGVANPTPFDYPTATSVGRLGEDRLIEAVATGRVSQVCAEPRRGPEQELTRLRAAIDAHLTRGPDLGLCVAYSRADVTALAPR